jgi:hypothetical protein
MIRIQYLIYSLILICSLQQHVSAVMESSSTTRRVRNVHAVKDRKIALGREHREKSKFDSSSLEDAMEIEWDEDEMEYDETGLLDSVLPRTFLRRRLQFLPFFPSATPTPTRTPTKQPVATVPVVTRSPTNQPVAPVAAPAPSPVNRMPVEPPVGVLNPILKLVTHFVIEHIEANPLTEPVLQIINEAIMATIGPTPSLIEITDWVLNEVNLRKRRLMISPDCEGSDCGEGDTESFSYTITACLSYSASDLLGMLDPEDPQNGGSNTIPLIELVDLAKEVVDGIVNAVNSGELTDEIQNKADDANETILADAQAVACTVDCETCSLLSSTSDEPAAGVQKALSSGQIAGICIGGFVACGAMAAFITSYYYPNLFSSSKQNEGENRGNSDGEQSDAVETIEYTENHGQAVIAAAAKFAVKKKSEHSLVTRKKSYLSVGSNDILDKMERNEPPKPLSLLLPLEMKDIQVEESMPQILTENGPPVTDNN